MDKLDLIFARQRELLERFHQIEAQHGLLPDPKIPVDITTHQGQAVLKSRAWNVTEEIAEAIHFALTRSERADVVNLRIEPRIQKTS